MVAGLCLPGCFEGGDCVGGSCRAEPALDSGADPSGCIGGTLSGDFTNSDELLPLGPSTPGVTQGSLQRLASVRVIEGSLRLTSVQPEDLKFLRCLEEIHGTLDISFTTGLRDLSGLERIRVLGSLQVSEDPDLTSLHGLAQELVDSGGTLTLGGVTLSGNPQLSDVELLEHFETTQLTLIGNRITSLPTLVRPERLVEVDLRENALTDLAGLRGAISLGSVTIEEANLQDLGDLASLQHARTFRIDGDALTDLTGLSSLESIDEQLLISGSVMTNLRGLDSLSVLTGELALRDLPMLEDLSGLEALTEVGRLSLTAIGDVRLSRGPKSLHGLEGVQRVRGLLTIDQNKSLETLQGLEGLQQVDGVLQVINNPKLTDLEGLQNLRAVGEDLIILSNERLSSLQALGSELDVGRLLVLDNPALPDAAANALATRLERFCACDVFLGPACECTPPCTCVSP